MPRLFFAVHVLIYCNLWFRPNLALDSTVGVRSRSLYGTLGKNQRIRSFLQGTAVIETDEAATQPLPWKKDNGWTSSVFDSLAHATVACLYHSDLRRDAVGTNAPAGSSATNWIDQETSFRLQQTMTQVRLKGTNERTGLDRDEAGAWLRWLKSMPSTAVLDLSSDFRQSMDATILTEDMLDHMDQKRADVLARMGCRMVLLPSGTPLNGALLEPSASLVVGKLLYGGVMRCRLLGGSHSSNISNTAKAYRRAGVRTEVKLTAKDNVPSWMMYGGPDRMYEGVDMGAAAVLEVYLLPRGKTLDRTTAIGTNMELDGLSWSPANMFSWYGDEASEPTKANVNGYTPASLSGRERNEAFRADFQSSVGGLQTQIDAIVRRVLDGRVIRPADDDKTTNTNGSDGAENSPSSSSSIASLEAQELELLGLSPVRGLLLYGPPGCGKTALAREISRALQARKPKIVSAPELLDRWVGGSEKLVRLLFADAEAELAACQGDATKSALHVVVIDEIDAVFRKRSSGEDSGEATRSSVVNQILSKLDGVNSIPNLLLIGMTNRRELLDDALLRPGRLEVQIEIPLPDMEGRREILQIHFDALRRKGRLSHSVCCAIDGVVSSSSEPIPNGSDGVVDLKEDKESGKKRQAMKTLIQRAVPFRKGSTTDLASDSTTGAMSGADLAGLVRCAGSLALARSRKDGHGVGGLLITMQDVEQALVEVKR